MMRRFSLFLATALLAAAPARTAEPQGGPAPLSLRELIDRAKRSHPEVAIARAEHESARAREAMARALRRTPRISGTGTFGVVPRARGSIQESPDTPRDLDNFGPFWRLRLDASMPIWAGGGLAAAERAARSGVASREAGLRARTEAAALVAARAYFGYVLAEQLLGVLDEVRGHLGELLERLQAGEDEDRDPLDVFKARAYGFQLDRLAAKGRRGLAEARIGLCELGGADVRPRAERLPRLDPGDVAGEAALSEVLERNAELAEARRAAEARELLARAEGAQRGPLLSLDGRLEWGRAPGRTPQDNPFVYDPWNVRTLGAALALRWDLGFKQSAARALRSAAEARVARARAKALEMKLRAQLAADGAAMAEAQQVYETSRRALSTTGNWLRLAEENHALGSASTKDLVDAYTAYVAARAAHFEALHDLDLSVVSWRLALGREPLADGEDP